MENNKITDQDKVKIESIVNMSIANKCYEEMESNKDYALIPVYCHLFVGNAQKGEIVVHEIEYSEEYKKLRNKEWTENYKHHTTKDEK